MRLLPMFANTPGFPDLVHHTVKHFLDRREAPAWDRVPAGSLGAREARERLGADDPPARWPTVDTAWWRAPWRARVEDAHDRGYRPRYELLASVSGDPAGPRWEPTERGRRYTEFCGFRLVLEPRGQDWQVITAFFSPLLAGADDLPQLAPALRAFAARRHCPPAGGPGVSGGESTS